MIREHNKVGDGNRLMLKGKLKTCYPEPGAICTGLPIFWYQSLVILPH